MCNEHNFARRDTCRQCNYPKDGAGEPGDEVGGSAVPANWKPVRTPPHPTPFRSPSPLSLPFLTLWSSFGDDQSMR